MLNQRYTNQFENEILDLIDNQDEFTRSDLQGVVTVLVNKIMLAGQELKVKEEKHGQQRE